MSFLFDRLRPKIDETALYDDASEQDERDRPSRAPAVRWKVVLTCSIIVAVGVLLALGAVLIGQRVDWVLTDTIVMNRGARIWAWVPMIIVVMLGATIAYYGIWVMWTARRRQSDRGID